MGVGRGAQISAYCKRTFSQFNNSIGCFFRVWVVLCLEYSRKSSDFEVRLEPGNALSLSFFLCSEWPGGVRVELFFTDASVVHSECVRPRAQSSGPTTIKSTFPTFYMLELFINFNLKNDSPFKRN